jgi:hypothetical protein
VFRLSGKRDGRLKVSYLWISRRNGRSARSSPYYGDSIFLYMPEADNISIVA